MAKNFDMPWDPPKPPKGPRPTDKQGRPMVWRRVGDRRNSMSGWQWNPMSDDKKKEYDLRAPKLKRELASRVATTLAYVGLTKSGKVAPKVTPKPEVRTKDGSGASAGGNAGMPVKTGTPKGSAGMPVKKNKPKTYYGGA